jgi:hypothetical protein
MRPTVTPNIAKAATKGMVISSPSMKNLLSIISTVPGLPSRKQKPGAVGLRRCYRLIVSTICIRPFTIVKATLAKVTERFVNAYLRSRDLSCFLVWPVFDPVNISGKYRGSAGPVPAGSASLDSCHRSIPSKASKEICQALKPTWHWSVFPVALCCKVRPLTSCLL